MDPWGTDQGDLQLRKDFIIEDMYVSVTGVQAGPLVTPDPIIKRVPTEPRWFLVKSVMH